MQQPETLNAPQMSNEEWEKCFTENYVQVSDAMGHYYYLYKGSGVDCITVDGKSGVINNGEKPNNDGIMEYRNYPCITKDQPNTSAQDQASEEEKLTEINQEFLKCHLRIQNYDLMIIPTRMFGLRRTLISTLHSVRQTWLRWI